MRPSNPFGLLGSLMPGRDGPHGLIDDLRARLKAAHDQIDALHGKLKAAHDQIDALRGKLKAAGERIRTLTNTAADLALQLKDTKQQLEAERVKVRLLQKRAPKPDIKPNASGRKEANPPPTPGTLDDLRKSKIDDHGADGSRAKDNDGSETDDNAAAKDADHKTDGSTAGDADHNDPDPPEAPPRRRGKKQGRETARKQECRIENPVEGSRSPGCQEVLVQVLHLSVEPVVFRLERRRNPDNSIEVAPLPCEATNGFTTNIKALALALYHQGQSTMPRVAEILRSIGLNISDTQVKRLLNDDIDIFLDENDAVFKAGLAGAVWISVDDTGARHDGENGYTTSIGNDRFCCFFTTPTKSRLNVLSLLSGTDQYVINHAAET